MFDLAWSEIAVIGLVSVLVLGPKELPQAMRTMAKVVRKMRSLTSELQGHVNDIVRDAELEELRQSVQKFSSTNVTEQVAKMVDPTGEMQAQLSAPVEGDAAASETAPPPTETAALPPVVASGPTDPAYPTIEPPEALPPEPSSSAPSSSTPSSPGPSSPTPASPASS